MNVIASASSIHVSAIGLIVGLVLAVLIVLAGKWAAREVGERLIYVLAVIVAVIVFFVCGFDVTGLG